jgi:hypothetical protein
VAVIRALWRLFWAWVDGYVLRMVEEALGSEPKKDGDGDA